MEASQKAEILNLVAGSSLSTLGALSRLGLAKSTYYRWRQRQAEGRLEDRKGGSKRPWNKLRPEEEAVILAWELQPNMAAPCLIEVVQQAIDFTGMTDVPIEDRTSLLSDNGAGYLSSRFNQYLRLVGIHHITASPYHPQTNGKMERYYRTVKGEVTLSSYEMPSDLAEAIGAFVEYYKYERYHEGLGNVTPWDVYTGKREEILEARKEVKTRTLETRKGYNGLVRERVPQP